MYSRLHKLLSFLRQFVIEYKETEIAGKQRNCFQGKQQQSMGDKQPVGVKFKSTSVVYQKKCFLFIYFFYCFCFKY